MKKRGQQLVKEEEREEGDVATDAYYRYVTAGGVCLAACVVLFVGLGRAAEVMGSFWLSLWAERSLQAAANDEVFTDADTTFHLGIYALLGFLGICGLGKRLFRNPVSTPNLVALTLIFVSNRCRRERHFPG